MNRKILISGTVLGILAIILGAFASHGLKDHIDNEDIATFETGVRYQMYHALLLLVVGGTSFVGNGSKRWVLILVVVGLVFFSGSIYGLATNELTAFDFKKTALITPIGGMLLIAAWAILLVNALRFKSD